MAAAAGKGAKGPKAPSEPAEPKSGEASAGAVDPRVLAQVEQLQREVQAHERRIAALEQAIQENQRALATLSAMDDMDGAQEILVPIGAGVLVRAQVDPSHPVLRGVGSEMSIEGSVEDARKALEERQAAFERAYTDAQEAAQGAAEALQGLAQSAGMV